MQLLVFRRIGAARGFAVCLPVRRDVDVEPFLKIGGRYFDLDRDGHLKADGFRDFVKTATEASEVSELLASGFLNQQEAWLED